MLSNQSPVAQSAQPGVAATSAMTAISQTPNGLVVGRNGSNEDSQNHALVLSQIAKRKKVGPSYFSKNRGLFDDEDKDSRKSN